VIFVIGIRALSPVWSFNICGCWVMGMAIGLHKTCIKYPPIFWGDGSHRKKWIAQFFLVLFICCFVILLDASSIWSSLENTQQNCIYVGTWPGAFAWQRMPGLCICAWVKVVAKIVPLVVVFWITVVHRRWKECFWTFQIPKTTLVKYNSYVFAILFIKNWLDIVQGACTL